MQIELKQLQRKLGITFVFVTHDQEEALSLSDRVVVMREGGIEQVGTPQQVYEEPANLSVASFIGEVNIFDATITDINDKHTEVAIEDKKYDIKSKPEFTLNQRIHVLVRPEDLVVWDQKEVEDPLNMFAGIVEEVIYKGTTVDLMVRLSNKQLITASKFFNEDDDKLE
jgi:spermidine/putrescine transport system ATP-binding protein